MGRWLTVASMWGNGFAFLAGIWFLLMTDPVTSVGNRFLTESGQDAHFFRAFLFLLGGEFGLPAFLVLSGWSFFFAFRSLQTGKGPSAPPEPISNPSPAESEDPGPTQADYQTFPGGIICPECEEKILMDRGNRTPSRLKCPACGYRMHLRQDS